MTEPITSFPTASNGIAAETALLEAGGTGLLIWRADLPSIVMPWHFASKPGFDIAASEAREMGWPVVLRRTGGGAVPQGPGVINLAMVWPAGAKLTIDGAYHALCAPMIAASAQFGLSAVPGATEGSFCDGTFNLAVEGRKIVGTAQRWRSRGGARYVLAHAMIMLSPPAPEAIRAINLLHRGLGLDLPIRGEVHAGLSSFLPDTDAENFAENFAFALRNEAGAVLARLSAAQG